MYYAGLVTGLYIAACGTVIAFFAGGYLGMSACRRYERFLTPRRNNNLVELDSFRRKRRAF